MNNTPLAGNQPHSQAHLPPEAAQGANGFSIGGAHMGFTKLDQMILQSSVMAESPEVFKIWIALLAACGPDGIAPVSAVYLSSICRLPQDVVDAALKRLTEPDEHSRTPDNDGRRIERCDGGWCIYNYLKYRAKKIYSDSPGAKRQRKHRDKDVTSCDKSVTGCDSYASASASTSSSDVDLIFTAFWDMYPLKVGKGAALKAWAKIKEPSGTLELIRAALVWQKKTERWTKNNGEYIPNPSTYLNQQRWLDENKPKPVHYYNGD